MKIKTLFLITLTAMFSTMYAINIGVPFPPGGFPPVLIKTGGIYYCQHSSFRGRCSWNHDGIDSLSGMKWGTKSQNNEISSFKVVKGWEAWVCADKHYKGKCLRWGSETKDVTVHSSDLRRNGLHDNISSILVQPMNYQTAEYFFKFKEPEHYGKPDPGEIGELGFIFVEGMKCQNSSKGQYCRKNGRKLFLKQRDKVGYRKNILMKDGITHFPNDSNQVKVERCPHAKDGLVFGNLFLKCSPRYQQFTGLYGVININEKVKAIPSFAMFVSGDTVMNDDIDTCETAESRYRGVIRSSCFEYDDVDNNTEREEYLSKIMVRGDRKSFDEYGDNHDLLWIQGHGSVWSMCPATKDSCKEKGGTLYYDSTYWGDKVGELNTDWFITGACNSMGKDEAEGDEAYLNYPHSSKYGYLNIPEWKRALHRLHGVGGMFNSSWWMGWFDAYSDDDFWDGIDRHDPVSQVWVDALSNDSWTGNHRDARFLTRENKDCTKSKSGTYMYNDRFYFHERMADKPLDSKGKAIGYKHFCMRDLSGNERGEGDHSDNYPYSYAQKKNSNFKTPVIPEKINRMLEEEKASVFETMPLSLEMIKNTEILKPAFKDVKIEKKASYTLYHGKDAILEFGNRKMMFSFKREINRIGDVYIPDFFNPETFKEEASDIASSLTELPLKLVSIKKDRSVSFVESESGDIDIENETINRVIFTYKPQIEGIDLVNSSIKVHFDAEGFYRVSSTTPFNMDQIEEVDLKPVSEIIDSLPLNVEFDKSMVAYVIDSEGIVEPVYLLPHQTLKQIEIVPLLQNGFDNETKKTDERLNIRNNTVSNNNDEQVETGRGCSLMLF